MSEFNPLGRFPSLRQVESPPAAKPESKAVPSGRLPPGKGSMRVEEAADVAGRDLGSRVATRHEAPAVPASGGLPPLAPGDGESLNLIVMALATAARTDKLTPARIERVVDETLKKVVNPGRQGKQRPALALDADTTAHLVRRLVRNARQFFGKAEQHDSDYRHYQAVVRWASARLIGDRNLLHFGMHRQAVLEGLPAGAGSFGDPERVGLRSGVEALVAASGGARRGRDEVFEDARDVLALAGPQAHPGWLETAMYALNTSDRRARASVSASSDAKYSTVEAGQAQTPATPPSDGLAGEDAAVRRALDAVAAPLRRQEQLIGALLEGNPQAAPEQLFGAFSGLGRGAVAAGLIDETDAAPLMRLLVHHALRRGVDSVDELPAMIAGLAEGLRAGFAGRSHGFIEKVNRQLAEAVMAAGGARLGPFSREIAQVSLDPGFVARMGYGDAVRSPLRPRDGKQ